MALKVTEPAVDSKLAAPGVLQEFGRVIDLAVVIETEPPAERVVRFVKMSLFEALFEVNVIEPVPVVVTLLLAVAK